MNSLSPVESNFDAFADDAESPVPFPYEVSFIDSDTSPAVKAQVEEYLVRLSHHYDRITFAHVYVRIPHKHRSNRLFHVHVQVDVPGRRLVVSREPEASDKHMDIRLALRDAFQKVTRQLEGFNKSRNEHKGRVHQPVL